MLAQRRFYYTSYLSLTLFLFGALGAMGLSDRDSLKQLVEERGPVELGTALLWGGVAVLALVVALRGSALRSFERRSWFALAVVGFFFAGEEVEWGRALPGGPSSSGLSDAHNWAARFFADTSTHFPDVVWVSGAALLVGALFVVRRSGLNWLQRARIVHSRTPLLAFLATALAWLVIATTCDLIDALGLPYLQGQWILEETSELLAAVSACTGIVAHLLCAKTHGANPSPRIPRSPA